MKIRNCPKCGGTLAEAERQSVGHEVCKSCNGLWFDSFALDVLFAKHATLSAGSTKDFMALPLSEASELSCAACSEPMKTGTKDGISIDWCGSCRGVFLDEGELSKLVEWRRSRKNREDLATAKDLGVVLAQFLAMVVGRAVWFNRSR